MKDTITTVLIFCMVALASGTSISITGVPTNRGIQNPDLSLVDAFISVDIETNKKIVDLSMVDAFISSDIAKGSAHRRRRKSRDIQTRTVRPEEGTSHNNNGTHIETHFVFSTDMNETLPPEVRSQPRKKKRSSNVSTESKKKTSTKKRRRRRKIGFDSFDSKNAKEPQVKTPSGPAIAIVHVEQQHLVKA